MKEFFAKTLKKKSVKAILVILLVLLVRKAYIRIDNLILSPAGTEVSSEELNEDIRKIAYSEKFNGHGSIEDPDVSVKRGVSKYFKKAKAEDRVLYFYFARFFLTEAPKKEDRGEIRAFVKSFFYIKSHKLPSGIIGVTMRYNEGMNGYTYLFTTIEELEELYRQVYKEGIPLNEQIDLLADIIIEKSGYYRYGSEFWINKPEQESE